VKAQVKKDGVLIPKSLLKGVKEVEIRKEGGCIVVQPVPAPDDPIFGLGSNPGHSGLGDLSARHDEDLYGKNA
jgi:virulence-associated protein VagC